MNINGEEIDNSDIGSVERIPEIVDITRRPMDPSGMDDFRRMVPSGLVEVCVTLKSGRVIVGYEESAGSKDPA